jgi:hypothetical protein
MKKKFNSLFLYTLSNAFLYLRKGPGEPAEELGKMRAYL